MGRAAGGEGGASLPFALLLIGLVFLLYGPVLGGAFVYDDNPAIVARSSLDDLGERARQALTGRRTLTDFTFALNRAASGLDPTGYHAVNILLHGGSALLVFLLAGRVLGRLGLSGAESRRAARAASLLFACHPLLAQAVAYTAQRYTSLAAFLYLLALFLYVRGRDESSHGSLAGAFVAAYLAMRSKEIAFTLPFAVVAAELILYRGQKRRLRFALPFLLLLPLIPLSLLEGREGIGRNLPAERLRAFREAPGVGRTAYLATQLGVIVRYLLLLVAPVRLTADHAIRPVGGLGEARALFPLALLAAIGLGAAALRKKEPFLLVGYGWFLLTLSVTSSVVPIRDLMVEHRAYLPSVGIFLVAGALLARVGRKGTILLVALLVPLALATRARSRVWSGPIPLWEDAARKAPGLVRPWVNLGRAYQGAGRLEESLDAYRRALEGGGDFTEVHTGMGAAYERLGDADRALASYARARAIAPDYGPAYDRAADLLDRLGRAEEAERLLDEGIARAGGDPARFTRLGDLFRRHADRSGAADAYRRALLLAPHFEPAAIGLAQVLTEEGRGEEAEAFLAGEVVARETPFLWNALGLARLALGREEAAREAFRAALRLDPGNGDALRNLRRVEETARTR